MCPSNCRTHWPVSTSHFRAVVSQLPVKRYFPSALKHIEATEPVCPSNRLIHWPVSISHCRAVLSPLAVNRCFSSASKHKEWTKCLCPSKRCTHLPVSFSHCLAVLSLLTANRYLSSALRQTELTKLKEAPPGLFCKSLKRSLPSSSNCRMQPPVSTSHCQTTLSLLTANRYFPSELRHTG